MPNHLCQSPKLGRTNPREYLSPSISKIEPAGKFPINLVIYGMLTCSLVTKDIVPEPTMIAKSWGVTRRIREELITGQPTTGRHFLRNMAFDLVWHS